MLKKILLCLGGIIIGNIIVLGITGIIMLIKKSQIDVNRFWETVSWFKYSIILDLIQIFIFTLIIIWVSKFFKFEFIKPNTNFLVLGFLYSTLETLSWYCFVDPFFTILHKNKTIDFFMENISRITHLPFITISEITIIPFIIFIVIVSIYNYFF